MTLDPRSFLRERSYTFFIIIFMKSNDQTIFLIFVTQLGWGPFLASNAHPPLYFMSVYLYIFDCMFVLTEDLREDWTSPTELLL